MDHQSKLFIEANLDVNINLFRSFARRNLYILHPNSFYNLFKTAQTDCFLNPTFFTKYTLHPSANLSVEQIFFGYIEPENRVNQIDVYCDNKGIIFLPEIGYLTTEEHNCHLNLEYDHITLLLRLSKNSENVLYRLMPIINIANTHIELVRFSNPILDLVLDNACDSRGSCFSIEGEKYHDRVSKAFNLIEHFNPWLFEQIKKCVKQIVVFESQYLNSFTQMTCIGTNFISAKEECSEIFFIEDIVHQSSHNILYLLITGGNIRDFFIIDPISTLVSSYTGNEEDRRTIFSAFHGIFSLSNISHCLSLVYANNNLSISHVHELKGRLADSMNRLGKNLHILNMRELFTEKGWYLYNIIKARHTEIFNEFGHLIIPLNVTNQSYVFSFEKFLSDNPL